MEAPLTIARNATALRRRTPRTRPWPGVVAALLLPLLAGCDDATELAPSGGPTPAPDPPEVEALPAALYRTDLTFVGAGSEPLLLHLELENRTDSLSLRLRYRGWFGSDGWRSVLDHSDSLPVPRAAWRVLPTGPVRVVASEGAELSSVILELPQGRLRLDSRGVIGAWNTRTGQRESLRLAELLDDSGAQTGLLLARQRARPIDEPPALDRSQAFLVADSAGNGLLLLRDSASPDAPVTAWTWFEDTEAEWSDALILALAAPEDAPGRWSVELPEAGVLGELRGVAPYLQVEADGESSGFEAFRLEATLVLDGESWSMQGIGLQDLAP